MKKYLYLMIGIVVYVVPMIIFYNVPDLKATAFVWLFLGWVFSVLIILYLDNE